MSAIVRPAVMAPPRAWLTLLVSDILIDILSSNENYLANQVGPSVKDGPGFWDARADAYTSSEYMVSTTFEKCSFS